MNSDTVDLLKLEALINIFTINKGEVKVLLVRKKQDPYKGYWVLPGAIVKNKETVENAIDNVIYDKTGLINVYMEQSYLFNAIDRHLEERVVAISFLGLVDSVSVTFKKEERPDIEMEWFKITAIPKTGYDHADIIRKNIEILSKRIINSNVLKSLFPSDFTLPELQRAYEQILGKNLDRRNFRKKFINFGLVCDTGYKNEGFNGRPAKLYCFNENIKERDLF